MSACISTDRVTHSENPPIRWYQVPHTQPLQQCSWTCSDYLLQWHTSMKHINWGFDGNNLTTIVSYEVTVWSACVLTLWRKQLPPSWGNSTIFNLKTDAAHSVGTWYSSSNLQGSTPQKTAVLMSPTCLCANKTRYDSLLMVFAVTSRQTLLWLTFCINIHSQILKYIHVCRMCNRWHVWGMPFVADIDNCLCANIQYKSIHQRDIVAHPWLIWNLQVAA